MLKVCWMNCNLSSRYHQCLTFKLFSLLLLPVVAFTMNDVIHQWNDGLNSVQISNAVSLPEWKVLGHREKNIQASLSTGNLYLAIILKQNINLFKAT